MNVATGAGQGKDAVEASVDAGGRMGVDRYIEERMHQYQGWYDAKAVKTKRRHLQMRAVSVVAGAIVPVLVNVHAAYMSAVTTALSLLVVILVSLESVFHYREQWKNYRSTEQFIGHEAVFFEAGIGPYEGLGPDVAFRRLVERVENAIAAENASTLNTMTLAGQVAGDSKETLG